MADKQKPSFVVNGKTYPFPTDPPLDIGEMCDAEIHFGVEFGNNRTSGVRMVAALLFTAMRRVDSTSDPAELVAQIRALPPEVFESFEGMEDDAGPPEVTQGEQPNETEQPNKNGHSGSGLSITGDVPDEIPEATGPESLDMPATLESTTSPA